MGFLGSYAGDFFGSWFGAVSGGGATPIGPSGTLLPWFHEAISESLGWMTDITKTFNGKERRASLNGSSPLRAYEASVNLDDWEARYLRARLVNDPAACYLLPLRFESLLATLDVTATTVTVTSTASADWVKAGQRVLLEDSDGTRHATYIESSTATTITINASVPSTMPAGLTIICPLESVYLVDGEAVGHHAANASEWRLRSRSAVMDDDYGAGATLTTFDSLTVLDRRPTAESLAQEESRAQIWFADYGGAVEIDSGYLLADVNRSHEFAWHTRAERQWWRLFLNHARGRFKTFLLPTWLPDLTASTTWSTTALTVYADDEHGDYIADWTSRTRLQIELSTGEILYRKVNSYVDNGNGTHTLTLNSANSGGSTTVDKISFLELVRLGEDMAKIDHVNSRSHLSLSFVVVQQ